LNYRNSTRIDTNAKVEDVLLLFQRQSDDAAVIEFSADGWPISEGGHLQGIQRMNTTKPYFIISGSSDHEAYFIIVGKTSDGYGIVQKKAISCEPYRHAGGIQIIGDYLAVGAEDNSKRDSSRAYFFDISEPEKPIGDPVIIIWREGEEKLATAGAVAVVKRARDHLLIVGSWDSDTLDLYESNGYALGHPRCDFEYWQTWSADDAFRDGWCDDIWGTYQNLNLISDVDDNLFLVGYYCNEEQEDYADLYLLDLNEPTPDILRKENSRLLKCSAGASFKYGGGLYINDGSSLISYACEKNCREKTMINEFR